MRGGGIDDIIDLVCGLTSSGVNAASALDVANLLNVAASGSLSRGKQRSPMKTTIQGSIDGVSHCAALTQGDGACALHSLWGTPGRCVF